MQITHTYTIYPVSLSLHKSDGKLLHVIPLTRSLNGNSDILSPGLHFNEVHVWECQQFSRGFVAEI